MRVRPLALLAGVFASLWICRGAAVGAEKDSETVRSSDASGSDGDAASAGDEARSRAVDGASPEKTASEDAAPEVAIPAYETVVVGRREAAVSQRAVLPTTEIRTDISAAGTALTVGEAATQIPGLSLNAPAGPLYTNPSIRGLGGRRVVLLRNGRRVDSGKPIGVSGYFLGPHNTARIEVIRGPASVRYGSDAIGGVIHAHSPDPMSVAGASGGFRSIFFENNDGLSNALSARYGGERFGIELHGLLRQGGNYRTGSGETIENSFYEDKAVGGTVAFKPGAGREIVLSSDAYFGGESGRAVNALDIEKRRRISFPSDDNLLLDGAYRRRFSGGTVRRMALLLYYDRTRRHLRRDLFGEGYHRLTSRMDQQSDIHTVGIKPSIRLAPFRGNELLVGMDGRFRTLSMDQTIATYLPGGVSPPPARSRPYDDARRIDTGIFAEMSQLLGDMVTLSAGARGDVINQLYRDRDGVQQASQEGAVSGSVGVNFHPISQFAFTLNLGRAFRAPTMEEKFVELAFCKGIVCGRPDVVPETSHHVDVGIVGAIGDLRFEAAFFNILVDDYITLADSEEAHCDYVYTNLRRAWLIGGEGRISFDRARLLGPLGLKIWTQVAYTRGEDLENNAPLAQIPPLNFLGGLRLYGPAWGRLTASFIETTVVYNAPQERISPAGNVASQAETATESYVVADVNAGIRLARLPEKLCLDLSLSIRNIADTLYRNHLAVVPAAGRDIRLNLAIRF